MYNKILLTLPFLFAASSLNATIIDINFNDYGHSTAISDAQGVTFSLDGYPGDTGSATTSADTWSNISYLSNTSTGIYPTTERLIFDFDELVTDVSFGFQNWGTGKSFYTAYGLDNVELEIGSLTGANGNVFTLVSSGISQLVFDNGYEGYRDWQFGVASLSATTVDIPEPALIALLGVALLGFGASRKKS